LMQKAQENLKTKAKGLPAKLDQIREDLSTVVSPTKSQSTRNLQRNNKDIKDPAADLRSPRIPRNVNFYRHLIFDKHSSETDIEWVLKLRSPTDMSKYKMEATSPQAFSFYEKTLEGQQEKRVYSDLDGKNGLYQAQHLIVNRLGPTTSLGSVQFETGLRNYGASSDKLKTLERSWRNLPKKDRQEFPSLYPSYEETTKIKTWSTKNLNIQTHSAFEGYTTFPKYGELYDRQIKNVSEAQHLLKAPGQQMAAADWILSMRKYGDDKPKKNKENSENKGSLADLKKVNRKPNRI